MTKLDNKQLLLLSHLIYGVRRAHFINNGSVLVGKVAEKLISEIGKGKKMPKHPMKTTKAEWIAVLKLIVNDPKLSSYFISHYYRKHGLKCAVIRDRRFFAQDMTVVFRGSTIASDWDDNAIGVYQSDTPMQKLALSYVHRVKFLCARRITITGHSKGGNYAQYCAIRSGLVYRAVAFDAQGFSPEFIDKYQDRFDSRAKTIHNISSAQDVIHGLLITIPGIKQTFIKSPKMRALSMYHKFSALLDLKTGKFHPKTKSEGKYAKLMRDSSKSLKVLEFSQRKRLAHGLMSLTKVGITESKNIMLDLRRALRAIPDLLRFVFGFGKRRAAQKRLKKSLMKWKKSGMMKRYMLMILVLVGFWNK